jgi:hypothetical protein
VFGLTTGEVFVVAFIFAAVVSAAWWPRAGAAIARALAGTSNAREADDLKRDGNAPPGI